MKKLIVSIICFIVFISQFAACSSNVQSGGTKQTYVEDAGQDPFKEEKLFDEGKVTIKLLWEEVDDKGYDNWQKYYIIPFEKTHPGIKIDMRAEKNNVEMSKVQLAAGMGPDIFLVEPADIPYFVENGRLLQLDNYMKKYNWDKLMFNWAIKAGSINSNQYAIPHSYEGTLLWYNKDILDSNGWPVPKSRKEFEYVCTQAQKKGYIPIAYGTSDRKSDNMWVISDYFSAYSGRDMITKLLKGEAKFTDPEIRGAIELYNMHWQNGWYNNRQSNVISSNTALDQWLKQRAVFHPAGSWFPLQILNKASFKYGCTLWPSMREGISGSMPIGIGAALGINKESKHADEAAEFINFIYTEEKLLAESISAGEQTLCRNIEPELYPVNINPNLKQMMDLMDEATKENKLGYTIWAFFPGNTATYLYENIEKIFIGRITVEDYCRGAQKKLEKDLSDGWVFPLK